MAVDDLTAAWGEIATPATTGAMAGRLAPDVDSALGVTLAVDHTGLRHLLIPVPDDTKRPSVPMIKGLGVSVEELKVGAENPRQFIDLASGDPSMHYNFAVVSADIISALASDASNPGKALKDVLSGWKWFWSAPPTGLSEEKMLGLFGELWFLEFWLGGVSDETLATWRGPYGDRHDFTWPGASVEVKGTRVRSDGAAEHRISTLDQLENPEQGTLHLFSLRVRPDTVATHSLVASIDRLRGSLAGNPGLLVEFDERLGRVGYSPAHRDKYATTLRVVAEELYEVTGEFPRLTLQSFAGGVPAGIDDIAYTLDLAACEGWRIATKSSDAAARTLRMSLTPT